VKNEKVQTGTKQILPTKNLTMSSKTKRQREERRRENKKVNKPELCISDKIKRIKARCTY
jgi:hypothetical protein